MLPSRTPRALLIAASLLTSGAAAADPLAIRVQPAGQTVRPGQRAGFAVTAPGATSYRWYVGAPHVGGCSSDVSCDGPQTLVVAVGW